MRVRIRDRECAASILRSAGVREVEVRGGEIGFALAVAMRDPANRECVAVLKSALNGTVAEGSEAVKRLLDMGILRRGDSGIRLPECGKGFGLIVRGENGILPFLTKEAAPFVRFEGDSIEVDGVAFAFSYVLCLRTPLLRHSLKLAGFLAHHLIGLGRRPDVKWATFVGNRVSDLDFCSMCIAGARREVTGGEVSAAMRVLSTATARAVIALLRRKYCPFEDVRERDEEYLRAARRNVIKHATEELRKGEYVLRKLEWDWSEEDYYSSYCTFRPRQLVNYHPMVLRGYGICSLAVSYCLSRLDESDVPIANSMLRSAAEACRDPECVDLLRDALREVLKVSSGSVFWDALEEEGKVSRTRGKEGS